jgi:hypothetical protein
MHPKDIIIKYKGMVIEMDIRTIYYYRRYGMTFNLYTSRSGNKIVYPKDLVTGYQEVIPKEES